jgi:ferritin-like metal-binding protein YciE
MPSNDQRELVKGLTEAHALEKQASVLLERASSPKVAGDSELASVYSAHLLQTKEHARFVAERLEALGSSASRVKDAAMAAGALGIGAVLQATPKTPMRLAQVAYAFENLEIATYRFLHRLATRSGDAETASIVERILEQEEAAAELVAGTFDRALERTLGEEAKSPLISVTPIGKPSERSPGDGDTPHPGPQIAHETGSDEPVAQPPHVQTPSEGEHMSSPPPGQPVSDT